MIAINTNFGSDDDIDREIKNLEIKMRNAVNRKAELQEKLAATGSLIEAIRARIEELKRSSSTRFAKIWAKDALLIVMRENKRLHWRQAHRLIEDGGGIVGENTIKSYLSDGVRYGNIWGTGYYRILW